MSLQTSDVFSPGALVLFVDGHPCARDIAVAPSEEPIERGWYVLSVQEDRGSPVPVVVHGPIRRRRLPEWAKFTPDALGGESKDGISCRSSVSSPQYRGELQRIRQTSERHTGVDKPKRAHR